MPAPLDCPEMDCWRALLDDAVSPEERERCERHLESCPTCQERLDQADRCDGDWLGRARRVGDPTTTAAEPALADILERLHEGAAPPWADPPEATDLYFLEPSPQPEILGTLGNYEVLEVIGQGGMGIVLKALDPGLNRYVAIKVLAAAVAGSATGRRRFTREARAAAAVCHDHVVTVHGVHEIDGLPYLVMQYVAGESLQERIGRDGPLAVEEAVRIGMQTAAGLAAAHAQGLIHRDIKPANLLLENGVARVKITDFGLARMADDAGLTRDGVVAGTPEYMAPEQARGEPVDHRADLYSLGAVLYACCTGQPPFRGPSAVAVLRRVSDEQPVPIRTQNPQAPAWLEALATRLMAKDPAERFQSAAEVAALLEGYLAHLRQPATVPAPPLPPAPGGAKAGVPRSRARLPRRAWLLALALLGAGLLGGPVLLLQAPPPPKPVAAGGAAGAAAPAPAGPAKAHSRPWLTAVGFIGLLLLLTAFTAWWIAARRRRAEGKGRPAGQASASAPVRLRWSRRSVGRAALALLAAGAAAAGVWLMGGAARTATGPAQFHQDFRSLTEDNPVLRPIGLACQPDDRGERITLPAGQGKLPHTGYQADLTVHGDFDITTAFEILQADQPDSGYGVGVSLYAATDPKTNDAVTLAWRLMPDGKAVFVANRLVPTGDKVESHVQTLPATATAGKLRLQRVGSVVRYLVADGADAPFVCVTEADMGTADVRPVQVGGDAGGSQAALDARLLDFSVRAADLPELPEAERATTGAPRGRRALAAGLIGLAVLLTALAVWLAGSRRAGSATGPAPESTVLPRAALVRRLARRLWPLLVLPGGLAAGLFALWLTGGAKAPAARPAGSPPAVAAAFQQDFRTTDLDEDVWKALDPAPERDGKGLRIKLEAGPENPHQMAIDTTFPVRGDFEITASYEVLAVDRPDRGYGAGVGLYVPIDPSTQDAVSLSRRLKPNGQVLFESDRMMPADGKVRFQVRTMPSTAAVGKLRLERVGPVLTFLVADGADAPFVVLDRVDLGTADMRFVRLEGNAGQSDAGLDARFLDFTVRAGELPGAPASGLVASTPPARFSWLTAAAAIGLLIVLAALGSWLVRRRRGRPRRAPVPDTVVKPAAAPAVPAAAAPVAFACPGCGHGLKVKAELAGKKGKCPKCGHVLLVPAPVQAARPASPPA